MKKAVSVIVLLAIGAFTAYSFLEGNVVTGIISLVILIVAGLYVLGIWDEGKEDGQVDIQMKDGTASAFTGGTGTDNFEYFKKTRTELLKNSGQDDETVAINEAAGLLLDKDFEGSKRAYENIMLKYPDSRGKCLEQIGVAEFFLGNYEKALEYYIEAKDNGEDNSMTEDNIWEVCEILYKSNVSSDAPEKYLSLYPKGRYAKKAGKLVC
jgi:tetratricopeptide (TPR) repeat protein